MPVVGGLFVLLSALATDTTLGSDKSMKMKSICRKVFHLTQKHRLYGVCLRAGGIYPTCQQHQQIEEKQIIGKFVVFIRPGALTRTPVHSNVNRNGRTEQQQKNRSGQNLLNL